MSVKILDNKLVIIINIDNKTFELQLDPMEYDADEFDEKFLGLNRIEQLFPNSSKEIFAKDIFSSQDFEYIDKYCDWFEDLNGNGIILKNGILEFRSNDENFSVEISNKNIKYLESMFENLSEEISNLLEDTFM